MASDLSSGCMETIDVLDDEKEEGEISLEDVSSSEEGGMGHLTCSYINKTRQCYDCKSWGECAPWCNTAHRSKSQSRRDPVKGKENRHHIREAGCATTKHVISTLQEKNDDLVPISSDSDMEIVGLTDTSNRSKTRIKKKKRKKDYEVLTIDELISPASVDLPITEFGTLKTHYRELSPAHRSSRSRVISRSPIRKHRISRASFRSSRSPLSHPKSPILRRSERRIRSPKRSSPKRSSPKRSSPKRSSPKRSSPKRSSPKRSSPHRSPLKTTRRPPRLNSPPSTRSYSDRHDDVTRLLKKVKHLDSMGSYALEPSVDRSKEHQPSSLKEKLSNMLKRASDNNDNVTHLKEKSNETVNDADDEEDLALLRQKALETKQKKSNLRSSDQPTDVPSEKVLIAKNDDQDEEALQLRMIALRSAVMKKHQNRVQRGIRTNKKPSRSESPFSQSFLDDIPVPSDELFASPPCTPSRDSNYIEDMELDTDVEREKEKLPYSPTDKITADVPIDTTLLGIEPSDVSFININETNDSPIFDDTDERTPLSTGIPPYYDNTYMQQIYESHGYSCSPSQHGSETFHSDLNNGSGELPNHLRDGSAMCDLIDGICCQNGAYSGITLIHAPDASNPLPVTKDFLVPSIPPNDIPASTQMQQIAEQSNDILFANVDSNLRGDTCTYEAQTVPEYPVTNSPTVFAVGYAEPISPNESMITIDDLPENEADPLSSPVGDDKSLSATNYIPKEMALCQTAEEKTLQEPLYMQGVPDVTKDVNKIPTLINRTLVPVSLLKSNKQLQQPLPITRKRETQSEPTFKSAEMQPVIVTADENEKSGSNFKPIKLRLAKKSAPVLTAPIAFDNSINENLENESLRYQKSSLSSGNSHEVHSANVDITPAANNDVASTRKRRKRIKKSQRKSLDAAQLLEKQSISCSNNDVNKNVNIRNAFTLNQQVVEFDQSKNNDDKAQENLIENRELSNLQNATGIQKPISIDSTNVVIENINVEKNDHTTLPSAEFPQERNIVSPTNLTPNNSNSAASDKIVEIAKDDDRRQSIDEDENELRAILLASLKRTKSTDTNSASAVPVTTNCTTTDTQTSTQKTLTNKTSSAVHTTSTVSNNVPLSIKLKETSETEKKKKNDVMPASTQSSSKRRSTNVDTVKSPLKKMAKKAVIPASTKVVNNAKKYQNMIVQRRLNLRKLSNNTKLNENTWSNVNAPKASLHAPDTQRFVISLGSDTDSESESERRKAINSTTEKPPQDINADFEKNLQKFLRDMRKEQEQSAVKPVSSAQTTKRDVPPAAQTNKNSSNMHTPLAVRHLPASQQEEYRRLKQQILEREKLKLQRKVADNNNSNNNNKLLNTNATASSPIRSTSCEKKDTHIKQNQDKLKESEINSQQSSTEIKKKNVDAAKSASTLNTYRTSANKNFSTNIAKHSNSAQLQAKGAKKIPNNLSIRIINEIAPNHTGAGNKTLENVDEKQCVSDKQQNRPALRVLTKEEIDRKYVQIILKPDTIGRVVTISDKSALQCDTANASQNEKITENDVSVEILDEIDRNNENTSNTSAFSNASTTKLSNSFANLSANRQEHEDTMEATMLLSQYEAEREINRISLSENNSNNSTSYNVSSDDKNNTNDVWDALKKNIKAELHSLMNLSRAEQERYLRDTEHNLVARRYTVLDHLAEMSGNLRQWDLEKDLQNSLATEVKKLREQLKIAEERLQLQRDHVSSMGPKVSTAREKINVGRRECFKLSKICSSLGNRLVGKNYILPEAGGQLLSEKLKEVANHTRQFSKKKRVQSNDVSENSLQQISELCKDIHAEEDLLLQKHLANDAAAIDAAETNSDIFRLKPFDDENLSMSESSLNLSQTFANQLTPITRKETLVDASNLHNDEQVTPPNQDNVLAFESELCQSTPVEQNDKRTERNCTMDSSDLVAPSEMESSATDPSICQENEQNNKKASPQSPPPPSPTTTITTTTTTITTMTTTTMTTTMTMTKTKTTMTFTPYESILTHLKTSRNTNPHGVLCPYEMMGICRDEDCQYIHQSRNQT